MANVITSEFDLNRAVAPRLPSATEVYDRQYQDQLNNILRLYFNQLNNIMGQLDWNKPVDYIDFDTAASPTVHQTGRLD